MGSRRARRIVVIAASAGGLEALRELLSGLPADFSSPILVVLHVPATGGRALPGIMERAARLHAETATDGEALRSGRIYFAPPDRHMLVVGGTVRLSQGPRQNGHRPAADPLFCSAARAAGPRVIAVVLSGTLDDGAAGCAVVERRGGSVVIQDPAESTYDGMPRAAIAVTTRAVVLRLRQMAPYLNEQSGIPVAVSGQRPDPELDRYVTMLLDPSPITGNGPGITCPECGGQLHTADPAVAWNRYECDLGHSWSLASLTESHSAAVDRAMWSATLRLEERWRLSQELAEAAERRGHEVSAATFRRSAEEAKNAAAEIRRMQAAAGFAAGADGGADPASAVGPDIVANLDIAADLDIAGRRDPADRGRVARQVPGRSAGRDRGGHADEPGDTGKR